MGKILSKNLKNKAEKLYSIYPARIQDNFGENKKFLKGELKLPYSTATINLMAGYLCRYIRVQQQQEEIKVQKFDAPQAPAESA